MRTFPILMGFCLLFAISSCKEKPPKPLTQEQITTFIQKLESSVENRKPTFLNQAIDVNTFVKRLNISRSKRAAIKSAMGSRFNFGDNVIGSLSPKAWYSLVRQYEKDGRHHILMRLYDDGSMNYHDMELVRVDTVCKVADIYIYTSGENLSKTMVDLFGDINEAMDKGDNSWLQKVQRIRTLLNKQDYAGAKELYKSIPASLQTNKAVQIVNIEIAGGLGDEEYKEALARYEQLFPNEPNTHLLMIDAYAMRKEYDKLLNSVNALDSLLGGDPLLDYHRSIAYMNLEDEATAKACLERLVSKIPEFEDAVLELMMYYLDEHNYDKARKMEITYRADPDYEDSRITEIVSAYPEYSKWLILRSTVD